MSKYVKIYYGPYEAFHTTSHKPQKLRGTRDKLRRLGYRVDIIPVEYINYCLFEISGCEIFRCNIKNLQFNAEYEQDPISQRAVEACIEATTKLNRACDHFWFWSLLEECAMRRQQAPLISWPFDVEFKQYGNYGKCVNCCAILARKSSESKPHVFNYVKSKQDFLYSVADSENTVKSDVPARVTINDLPRS